MFVSGTVLNFVSFGFAAQSLLSALGAVQFLSNVVFARFVLKAEVTRRCRFHAPTPTVYNVYSVCHGASTGSAVSSIRISGEYPDTLPSAREAMRLSGYPVEQIPGYQACFAHPTAATWHRLNCMGCAPPLLGTRGQ